MNTTNKVKFITASDRQGEVVLKYLNKTCQQALNYCQNNNLQSYEDFARTIKVIGDRNAKSKGEHLAIRVGVKENDLVLSLANRPQLGTTKSIKMLEHLGSEEKYRYTRSSVEGVLQKKQAKENGELNLQELEDFSVSSSDKTDFIERGQKNSRLDVVDLIEDKTTSVNREVPEDLLFETNQPKGKTHHVEDAVDELLNESVEDKKIKNKSQDLSPGTQSIYLADMSGDGLNDLLRIRNGKVCYWPSIGYGRFGAKITMNNAPHFDHPEMFDQKRVRLADLDGSGTTDIIYLGREAIAVWFNQAGNSWSEPTYLTNFPTTDNLAAVQVVDLLGNGTACIVWSSPLPGQAHQPMQYIDLMGGQKPHLMTLVVNNLGAETKLKYVSSTYFYLKDRKEGNPWITRLPFPVHVVERVETCDRITENRFVTSYRYRHGYFDGQEREFRGFGYVEQKDTEEYEQFKDGGGTNLLEQELHVPPVLTKTWFHTGGFIDREHNWGLPSKPNL